MSEKLVVVTRKTRLQELVERFNTVGQARFYLEHAGGDFSDYQKEDETYQRVCSELRKAIDVGLKVHFVERSFLPNYRFAPQDVVLTVGQDGLVANTAKYVGGLPIVAINPDPARFDGVLLPWRVGQVRAVLDQLLKGRAELRAITLAQASTRDGQSLLAFNDLFIGARSHVSARYRIRLDEHSESQSSSGIIVSTGAGSTGWLSSIFQMARALGGALESPRMKWDDPELFFVVREPFVSRCSQAGLVSGRLKRGSELEIESLMPGGGAIFSDGVEADFIPFNAGTTVRIAAAAQQARLVVGKS